jgi:hypothetical protein
LGYYRGVNSLAVVHLVKALGDEQVVFTSYKLLSVVHSVKALYAARAKSAILPDVFEGDVALGKELSTACGEKYQRAKAKEIAHHMGMLSGLHV